MSRKKLLLALPAAFLLIVVSAAAAYSHGYTNSPQSRSYKCNIGQVTGCGAIQYEPQSVEGPKGFPSSGPADGKICAAGDSRWAPLDDPRGGAWPATGVTANAAASVSWHLTAAHATTKWEYWITKTGWNPSQPITRAQLEPAPFKTVNGGGARPPYDFTHQLTWPNKSGRHVLVSIWVIADTPNAFYQCADLNFGGGGDPDPNPTCPAAWNAGTAYVGGSKVAHNGHAWEAKWWTQGETPGSTGEWGVWRDLGTC